MKSKNVNNLIYKDFGESWYTSKGCLALLRRESLTKNKWVIEKLHQKYKNPQEIKILDVGCGAGFLTNELAKQNYLVTGIDLYQDPLDIAKLYDATKTVNYLQANALNLPFENESFDVLCIMDVLEHIENIEDLLKECSRVLKKNGQIYFHTFNRNWISWFLAIKCVEWFIKDTPKNLHVYNLFIKPQELISSFVKLGFKKNDLVGIQPDLTFQSVAHLLFKREIHPNFNFKITSSLCIGYLGIVEHVLP